MKTSADLTRRTLLRNTALGTIAAAAGVDCSFGQSAPAAPNIVFILADDLGYADVSCYGRPDISTPNIDGLAANGTRFLQAYANSAVCSATRTALITGRYQYRLPIGLEEPLGNRDVGLPPEHPTLPSLLKKAGYSTALLGKWHLGELPKFGPLQSGYDHFYGFHGGAVDYYTHAFRKEDFWDDNVPIHQMGYMTDLLGQPRRGGRERVRAAPQATPPNRHHTRFQPPPTSTQPPHASVRRHDRSQPAIEQQQGVDMIRHHQRIAHAAALTLALTAIAASPASAKPPPTSPPRPVLRGLLRRRLRPRPEPTSRHPHEHPAAPKIANPGPARSLLRRRLRLESEPTVRYDHEHRAGFSASSTKRYDLARVPPTVVRNVSGDSGFDWGDVGIGAGAALGLMLAATGDSSCSRTGGPCASAADVSAVRAPRGERQDARREKASGNRIPKTAFKNSTQPRTIRSDDRRPRSLTAIGEVIRMRRLTPLSCLQSRSRWPWRAQRSRRYGFRALP